MGTKPKFDFDDLLEYTAPSSYTTKFAVKGIMKQSPHGFYYISENNTHYPENSLKLCEKEVVITRNSILDAWSACNRSLWSTEKEYKTLNGLLKYFGFEEIK